MKGRSAGALVGLALASSTAVALLAQQEARSLRRLSITGGFTSGFNADRTELTLAPGDGPIDGVEVRVPEGGGLSVAREPIPGSDKRRLVITLAAGAPAPERAREQAAGGASEPAPAQDREPAPSERACVTSKPEMNSPSAWIAPFGSTCSSAWIPCRDRYCSSLVPGNTSVFSSLTWMTRTCEASLSMPAADRTALAAS